MPNHRQKIQGVRVRSEAKMAAADRLLLAAQECREAYDAYTIDYAQTPKWRWRRRRALREARLNAAVRHLQAITSAQDIAKKGRYVNV